MTELDERINDYGRKPIALLPPHIEPAKRLVEKVKNPETKIPETSKKRSGRRVYDLIGAGLIVAGALFSGFHSTKQYAQDKQQAKEQAKEQVVLAQTELAKKPYSPMLIENIIEATEKDYAKDYAKDYSANDSAKTPEGFIRPRSDVSSTTPKVLEMMLDAEKNSKPGYVFVVDKETQKAKVYKLTYELVDEADVSTGRNPGDKEKSGDNKTPNGIFEVQGIENSSEWLYAGKKAYGPKAARLNAGAWDAKGNYIPDGVSDIMAHGTDEPESLGAAASHGCVRFLNEQIQEYVDKGYLKKGTLFAIVENNDYVPARINAGPLFANNVQQAEHTMQTAQKPATKAYEKYSGADKRLGFITDAKNETKAETKAEAKADIK